MQLGGYILIELGAFVAIVGGAGLVTQTVRFPNRLWGGMSGHRNEVTESALLPRQPQPGDSPTELKPLEKPGHVGNVVAEFGVFRGIRDDYLLKPLRTEAIQRVKFNHGGSSISMRIEFEGGGRAAFKPDQTNFQSIPRKEVAAFRLNRLLGLSSVAPAIPRKFPKAELIAKLDAAERTFLPRFEAEVVVGVDDTVAGELSWWIPEIRDADIGGFSVDSVDGMVLWKRYLAAGEPVPAEDQFLLMQLSNLVVFDFLINNVDRWSGANVKVSPDRRLLYFMDNTMAFGAESLGSPKVRSYLDRVEKFSRSLFQALQTLDEERVRAVMTTDAAPYAELLTDSEIVALISRREQLVDQIARVISTHGEAAVLVFP